MIRLHTLTGHNEESLRALLASPFPEEAIEWKPQTAGWRKEGPDPKKPEGWDGAWVKLIAFITARAIQDRLDDVVGVNGWKAEFSPLPGGGMLCSLSIAFIDQANPGLGIVWITKQDGAPQTEIESVKGGISSALKRAATQWGIGRYLYHVDVSFGKLAADNDWSAKQVTPKNRRKEDQRSFRWTPPRLPAWAQFGGSGKPGVVSTIQQQRADAAVEALKKAPAGETVLPGTRRNFAGHGGKKLKDVPTLDLKRAMENLKGVGSETYTQVIEDIGEVLADRAGSGA